MVQEESVRKPSLSLASFVTHVQTKHLVST